MNRWPERRLLLSLVLSGTARRLRGDDAEFAVLDGAGWVKAGSRKGEVLRRDEASPSLRRRLDSVWPDWRARVAEVTKAGEDPLKKECYERVRVRSGAEKFPVRWPRVVNRRTAAALLTGRAKRDLGPEHRAVVGSERIVIDDVLRLRAFCPLVVSIPGFGDLDAAAMTVAGGDVCLGERTVDVAEFSGAPQMIVTVENKGAFVDMPPIDGCVYALAPGLNTRLPVLFAKMWDCPVVHFGDFDADGVEIARGLKAQLGNRLRWLVPDVVEALADSHGIGKRGLLARRTPEHDVLKSLTAAEARLEQEALVLHERFPATLAELSDQSFPFI